jgi:gelsolin
MPPNQGLVHLKEYDIKDSNVELIGSDLDHKVKYNSAASEPAWNNGSIGQEPGLNVWRVEDFEVIPWPKDKYGEFHEGDSYIVLSSVKVGKDENKKLVHDIYFWLGSHTSQDEAGTAAYKTVELDEFLHGAAVQHRELQAQMSDEFLALFARVTILKGGFASGFRHVEQDPEAKEITTLLRIFKYGQRVIVYCKQLADRLLDIRLLGKRMLSWLWKWKPLSVVLMKKMSLYWTRARRFGYGRGRKRVRWRRPKQRRLYMA